MNITLWGVRGSIPTPLSGAAIERKIRKALTLARPGDISSEEAVDAFIRDLPLSIRGTYGGNTTSIEVRTGAGDIIIIDCGSGFKTLGRRLMAEDFSKGRGVANIFMSHTHWDHIQGIPFFLPFYIKGNRFNFYSSMPDLNERLEYQQDPSHFPVKFDYLQATREFFLIESDDEFFLNDARIYTKRMPHPGGSFGYRIEEGGRVFVYTSDCEFNINEIDYIEGYRSFFENADVVIFDTQYTFEESIDKFEFGHSSAAIAIDIAGMFNIKRLILFHHEPEYDDEKLDSVLLNARSYLGMNMRAGSSLTVELAREGMVIEL